MPVKIQTLPNGPLKVEGDFTVQKADGRVVAHSGTTAHLCRCGASANKPMCDGAHKKAEFVGD